MAVSGRKTEKYKSSAYLGSALDYAHSCDACLIDKQDVEAHGYCVECQDYLCVTCYRSHRKSRASRDHRLIDNTSFLPENITKLSTEIISEKCSVHGSETLKFFCPKHEALGCHDCMTLEHRTCKIDYIPDKCSGLTKSKEFKDTLKKLDGLREDIKSVEILATSKSCELDTVHKTIVDDINQFQTDMNDRICQLRKVVIDEADKFKQAEENKIVNVLKICEKLASDVNQVQSIALDSEAAERDGQAFISIKRADQLIKSKHIKLTEAPLQEINTYMTFERNKNIELVFSGQAVFGKLIPDFEYLPEQIERTKFTRGMQTFASEPNPIWTKEAVGSNTGSQNYSDMYEYCRDGYEVPINRRTSFSSEENPYDSINLDDNAKKMVVRKLPRGVSEDTLERYFESKKHHQRAMIVKNVDLDIDNDEALITFDSASDVEYVLKRQKSHPCTLNRQTLVVEPLETADATVDAGASRRGSQNYSDMYEYSSGARDDETDTIEVRKFSENCTEDTLLFYFENKRRSGGGEIVSFSMQRDKGYAHITFKEMSVAKRVLEKRHIVEWCELTVVPFIISKTELLLDEVPDTVTEEYISNFVEAKLKVQVVSTVFSQDRCKCLVQCSERFDFSKAKEVCKKYRVGGVHVIPSQIPVTTGVVVTNIPEDIEHDSVEVYFENKQRSQGGETQKVEINTADNYCLVFFKDATVVGRVCQKKDHIFHGRHLDVKPYNEYFGLPLGQ